MELLWLLAAARVKGRQEVNVGKHTSRPGTSAVPGLHVLQEILRAGSFPGTMDVPG
jgi:hypothetical protein